jgi:hypothetical protein
MWRACQVGAIRLLANQALEELSPAFSKRHEPATKLFRIPSDRVVELGVQI